MKSVVIVGWRTGFNKVGSTRLLRERLGYSLPDAKTATEDILIRKPVTLMVSDEIAGALAEEFSALGADVEIRKSDD